MPEVTQKSRLISFAVTRTSLGVRRLTGDTTYLILACVMVTVNSSNVNILQTHLSEMFNGSYTADARTIHIHILLVR